MCTTVHVHVYFLLLAHHYYFICFIRMFTSNVTADLMKRKTNRHRKLHRAATQRTKLHDPIERLALFKRTSSHNVDKQINTSHDKEPMKFQ